MTNCKKRTNILHKDRLRCTCGVVGGMGRQNPPVIRGRVHVLSMTSRSSSDAFFFFFEWERSAGLFYTVDNLGSCFCYLSGCCFFFPSRDSLQDFCALSLPHLPPQEHSTYTFGGKLHSEPSLLFFLPPSFPSSLPSFSRLLLLFKHFLNACCVTGTGFTSKKQKPSKVMTQSFSYFIYWLERDIK